MKRKTVLLIDSNCDAIQTVLDAAVKTKRAVRLVTTCREAFQALDEVPNEIDVVLVDLEPEAHGLAIIEALGICDTLPPVIALTDREESYMRPIVRRHGAVDCIAKSIRGSQARSASRPCASRDPGTTRLHLQSMGAHLPGALVKE